MDDSIFKCSLWSCGFQVLLLFSVSYEILHFKLQMCCLLLETVKTGWRLQGLSLVYIAGIYSSVTQSLNVSLPVLCCTQCRRNPVIILRCRGCTRNKLPVHCKATGPMIRDKQPFTSQLNCNLEFPTCPLFLECGKKNKMFFTDTKHQDKNQFIEQDNYSMFDNCNRIWWHESIY